MMMIMLLMFMFFNTLSFTLFSTVMVERGDYAQERKAKGGLLTKLRLVLSVFRETDHLEHFLFG